jgi:hypothetical protein
MCELTLIRPWHDGLTGKLKKTFWQIIPGELARYGFNRARRLYGSGALTRQRKSFGISQRWAGRNLQCQ